MPITTHDQLEALRAEVREAIVHSITEALALLTKDLPTGRAKHNQVVLLSSRASDIANHDINNTLVPDLLDVLRNELRRDVLTFTDHLTLTDFGPEAPARPELKPGHLLYKVSPKMTLRETYECLIRIAHQLSHVLEGIELDDSVSFEELPIAEVMEVEVIDPSPEGKPAFDILLLSDGEQLVDEFSATDWVFNVRPLRAGEHLLVLKISVLITVGGKERTKNIVLQRPISVLAEAVETGTEELVRVVNVPGSKSGPVEVVEPEPFPRSTTSRPPMPLPVGSSEPGAPADDSGEEFSVPPPAPAPIPPAPQPAPVPRVPEKRRSQRMRYFSIAASILLVVSFAWWLLPAGNKSVDGDGATVTAPPSPGDVIDSVEIDEVVDSLGRDSLR